MQVCSVVGPDASSLAERLASSFDGRVATVERLPGTPGRDHPAAAAAYGLTDSGAWMAAGDDRSLEEVLDDLSPRYDATFLVDFPDARLPVLRLGDVEEERLQRAGFERRVHDGRRRGGRGHNTNRATSAQIPVPPGSTDHPANCSP